jgi:hypothetical protein
VLLPAYGRVPEATVNGEVESVAGAPQLKPPGPGLKPPVQVTVTAEMGMAVAQLEKLALAEYTWSFQGSLAGVLVVVHDTVVVALPDTVGESGSVAAKEMMEGTAYTVKFAVASGLGVVRAGRGTGAWSESLPICAANNTLIISDSCINLARPPNGITSR